MLPLNPYQLAAWLTLHPDQANDLLVDKKIKEHFRSIQILRSVIILFPQVAKILLSNNHISDLIKTPSDLEIIIQAAPHEKNALSAIFPDFIKKIKNSEHYFPDPISICRQKKQSQYTTQHSQTIDTGPNIDPLNLNRREIILRSQDFSQMHIENAVKKIQEDITSDPNKDISGLILNGTILTKIIQVAPHVARSLLEDKRLFALITSMDQIASILAANFNQAKIFFKLEEIIKNLETAIQFITIYNVASDWRVQLLPYQFLCQDPVSNAKLVAHATSQEEAHLFLQNFVKTNLTAKNARIFLSTLETINTPYAHLWRGRILQQNLAPELMQTIEEEMVDIDNCNDPLQRQQQQTVLAMECFYKASQQRGTQCVRLAKQYLSEIGLQDCRSLAELAEIPAEQRTTIENYYIEYLTHLGDLNTKEGFESGFSFSKKENKPHLFVSTLAERFSLPTVDQQAIVDSDDEEDKDDAAKVANNINLT
jgi:hypothetical protein